MDLEVLVGLAVLGFLEYLSFRAIPGFLSLLVIQGDRYWQLDTEIINSIK